MPPPDDDDASLLAGVSGAVDAPPHAANATKSIGTMSRCFTVRVLPRLVRLVSGRTCCSSTARRIVSCASGCAFDSLGRDTWRWNRREAVERIALGAESPRSNGDDRLRQHVEARHGEEHAGERETEECRG